MALTRQGSGSAACSSLALLLLLLLTVFLVIGCSEAADIFVNNKSTNNWGLSIDYSSFESGTFTTADTLIFNYAASSHDVWEVSKAQHDSCDTSSTPIKKYTSGNDSIALSTAGVHYYICSIPGHCSGGMSLAITVTAATPGSTTPTPTTPPPPGTTTPAGTNSAPARLAATTIVWAFVFLVVASFVL